MRPKIVSQDEKAARDKIIAAHKIMRAYLVGIATKIAIKIAHFEGEVSSPKVWKALHARAKRSENSTPSCTRPTHDGWGLCSAAKTGCEYAGKSVTRRSPRPHTIAPFRSGSTGRRRNVRSARPTLEFQRSCWRNRRAGACSIDWPLEEPVRQRQRCERRRTPVR